MSYDVNTITKQGFPVPKCNEATVDPTVNDDNTANFDIGDRWINTTSDEEFVVLDVSTGAAVWKNTTSSNTSNNAVALQVRRTTDYAITATLQNVLFDTTEIESSPSDLEHSDTNQQRIYFYTTHYHKGSVGFEFENTTPQDKIIDIELWLNDTTSLSNINFKIDKNTTEMVNRDLIIPPLTSGDYLTIRMKADSTGVDLKDGSIASLHALKGAKGNTGATGAAGANGADGDITWEGAWVSQNYVVNQAVEYLGSSYVCKLNTVSSEAPTNSTYWDLLASKGDAGSGGGNRFITIMKDNGADLTGTSGTYSKLARMVYDGANETLQGAKVHLYKTGGGTSVECRIYDVTNAQEIASVTTTSTSATNIVTFGALSNLPTSLALFNIEFKITGGGGSDYVNTSGILMEF